MRLKKGEGEDGAIVAYPAEKAIMHDRMVQAQNLARKHIQLQARQLAADLEVELRCRAKHNALEMQEYAKQERLDVREAIAAEERQRRLKERRDYEAGALSKAQYLEWATAAERLYQQDSLAQRRLEAGLLRSAESDRQAALRKERQEAMAEQLHAHDLVMQRARDQKAAAYDAKLGRISSMEARRDEMLDTLAQVRQDAYLKYDDLKSLAHLSAIRNDDDMLRKILEQLVPRLTVIPQSPRSRYHSPGGRSRQRAFSADSSPRNTFAMPSPRVYRSQRSSRPSSARSSGTSGIRAISLESPGRLVGIGGAARRRLLSPSKQQLTDKMDKFGGEDSRSASTASLGNSGILSASYGSASWESMSLSSPVGPQVSQLLANARGQVPSDPGSPRIPTAPVDCPLCYSTPRRPRRGVDRATYAKIARGMTTRQDDVQHELA